MTASRMEHATSIGGGPSLSDHDILGHLESRLPLHSRLVGRKAQLKELQTKYQQRKKQHPEQRPELVLITGPSGIGKSTLARSLEPSVRRDGGYFLAGKCSPMLHHHQHPTPQRQQQQGPRRQLVQRARSEGTPLTTPYAPFVAAFSQFVEQVIARGATAIQQVRNAVHEDYEADILVDVFPDFRRILLPTGTDGSRPPESSSSSNTRATFFTAGRRGNARDYPMTTSNRSNRTSSTSGTKSILYGSTDRDQKTNLSLDAASSPTVLVLTKFLIEFCGGLEQDRHGGRRRTQDLLVLVLDDIQWIDRASLELIKILLSEDILIKGITLVCTCRGNEVAVGDPLAVLLRELEESLGVFIVDIPVNNLAEYDVEQVLSQMLQCPLVEVKSLSSLVHQQTDGNPFSILQLLRSLYEMHLLFSVAVFSSPGTDTLFAPPNGSRSSNIGNNNNAIRQSEWQWDSEEIRNVLLNLNRRHIDVLSSRIAHISQESEVVFQVLQIASCMASEFDSAHMELIFKGVHEDSEVLSALDLLVEKKLIYVVSKNPEVDGGSTGRAGADTGAGTGEGNTSGSNNNNKKREKKSLSYCWVHDQFQKAAYNLIPESEQQQLHKQVGLRLLYNLSAFDLEKYAFLVVNQLLSVEPGQLERHEKYELVLLCVLAGRKAAQLSAFQSAGVYFNIGICYFHMGIGLADENRWLKNYDLRIGLYNAAAEMAYCNGDNETVDGLVGHILDHARCFEDKLRAYESQIHSLCARNNLAEAIEVGLYVLKRLGEPFSLSTMGPSLVASEIEKCRKLLQKPDEYVLGLRPLQDWKKITAIRIIQLIFPPIFQSQPQLGTLLAARVVQLTFEHGLTPMSCAGFAVLGTVLCYPCHGQYAEGNRLANLGLKIMAKYEASEMRCRMLCYVNAFCAPYVQPTRDCLSGLALGAQAGAASGDMEMSCTNLLLICLGSVFAGDRLLDVLGMLSRYQRRAIVLQQHKVVAFMSFTTQMILNLLGKSRDPLVLTGSACNEEDTVRDFRAARNLRALESIDLFKCFLALYLKKYDLARELALKLRTCKKSGLNALCMTQFIFLDAMAEVTFDYPTKWQSLLAGKSPLKRLTEYARLCPENMLNKVYLIEAERYAIRGQRDKAMSKYLMSIEHAEQQGLVQEQALAYERAGLRQLGWGKESRGLEYLKDAKKLYERWGASYKVDQLAWLTEKDKSAILDGNLAAVAPSPLLVVDTVN